MILLVDVSFILCKFQLYGININPTQTNKTKIINNQTYVNTKTGYDVILI